MVSAVRVRFGGAHDFRLVSATSWALWLVPVETFKIEAVNTEGTSSQHVEGNQCLSPSLYVGRVTPDMSDVR